MANIYKDKKRNSWYIHTKVKINDKWQTCTIRGFKTLGEAKVSYDSAIEKWKREHIASFNQSEIETHISDYVDYVKNGKSPRTGDRERTQFNTYFNDIFKYKTISDIYNVYSLQLIYQSIKDNQTLNVRKKHDLVRTFTQFSQFLYYRHLINDDIFKEINIIFQPIKYTKSVIQSRKVIPQCEIRAFLDTIRHENESHYILFVLLVFCGLRISELLGLCNDCFIDGKVIVKRQLLTNGKLSNKLKTKQGYRTIPIPSEIIYYFKNLEQTNGRFTKLSHTSFKRLLYYYENKAGIPHYIPHEFRHTCCFELAKKCENMSDVVFCAKCMGHSPSVFIDVYCNHLNKDLEKKFFS